MLPYGDTYQSVTDALVLFLCCSACLNRRKSITSDCSLCLFSALSLTSLASLHFSTVAAITVTHMALVDMVTHTPALATVIPMLMHLIVTVTVMDILTLPTHVLITAIPTVVISTQQCF